MSSLYVQAFKCEKTSQELQTSQNLQFKEHVLYLLRKVLLSCHFIAKEVLNQLDYFKLG